MAVQVQAVGQLHGLLRWKGPPTAGAERNVEKRGR
jgi:hypothetical protein